MQSRLLVGVVLVASANLAACGDDAVAQPAFDAAIDPAIAPLLGDWVKGADSYSGQAYTRVVFRADGTVTLTEGASAQDGTYTVLSSGRVRFVFTNNGFETDVVVANDKLLLGAMLSYGSATGFVGTWSSMYVDGGTPISATMVLAANNTGSYTVTAASAPQTSTGTWSVEGPGFVFTTNIQIWHMRAIGARAIGEQLFTKQ